MSANTDKASIHAADGGAATEPQLAIGLEMNHRPIPYINELPSEVLADIMQILVSSVPCRWADLSCAEIPGTQYPDVLSHVCSRWRQVALDSRSLWTHIDITTWRIPGSRATMFLDRAGQLPLRLHIVGFGGSTDSVELDRLLAPVTSQLKSLNFFIDSEEVDPGEADITVFDACLSNCTAGNLTELNLRFTNDYEILAPLFIMPIDHPDEGVTSLYDTQQADWVRMSIPQDRLENLLRGVTVLQLSGGYPHWTSSAYHGLVELRLCGGRVYGTSIAESQLISILKNSPKLRILHFGLVVEDLATPDTTIVDPIALQDLEVLSLEWVLNYGIDIFLRWLAPSPALSQFSYRRFHTVEFEDPATVAFLTSSNITMIHTVCLSFEEIVDLVGLCPRTHVLVIDNIRRVYWEKKSPLQLQVHTLYLLESALELDHFRQRIQPNSVQRLILHNTTLTHNNSALDPSQVLDMLSDVCAKVVVLPDGGPSPIEGWEALWDE